MGVQQRLQCISIATKRGDLTIPLQGRALCGSAATLLYSLCFKRIKKKGESVRAGIVRRIEACIKSIYRFIVLFEDFYTRVYVVS